MRHYQLMSQDSPLVYESVEEPTYTQLSQSPSVVRQCDLSPNKYKVSQGELSLPQSTNISPSPDGSALKATEGPIKVFAECFPVVSDSYGGSYIVQAFLQYHFKVRRKSCCGCVVACVHGCGFRPCSCQPFWSRVATAQAIR